MKAAEFHHAWRALPEAKLHEIIGGGSCLILAPHPDDESLGCGGLIASCVAAGRPPLVVVLTDGVGSHPNSRAFSADRLKAVRAEEVRVAVGLLGLSPDRVIMLDEPDTAAPREGPGLAAVVARLVRLIHQETSCTTILAPWLHDPHCDHEAASLAATAAAGIAAIRQVAYPVWGWTLNAEAPIAAAPTAGWRLDIASFLPAKRQAIQAHRTQYGGMITDDPTGFQLPPELLSVFDSNYETFLIP